MYIIAGVPAIIFKEMTEEASKTDKIYLKKNGYFTIAGEYETINDAVFDLIRKTKGTLLADEAIMVIADTDNSGPMAAIVSFTESINGIVCVVKEHNRNVPMIYDMQCKQLHNSKVL